MDAASHLAILRFVVRLCWMVFIVSCWRLVRPVAPVESMKILAFAFAIAGLIAALRAARRREKFLGACLNDWDEALAFVALSRLLDGFLLW